MGEPTPNVGAVRGWVTEILSATDLRGHRRAAFASEKPGINWTAGPTSTIATVSQSDP